MHFDLAAIPASDAYKLLVSTVVPRPIALATTVDPAGRVNAAPFSFFNAVSSIPPVVVLGISPGDPGSERRLQGHRAQHPRHRRVRRQPGRRGDRRADEHLRRRFSDRDRRTRKGRADPAALGRGPRRRASPRRRSASNARRITGLSLGRALDARGRPGHPHPYPRRPGRSRALLRARPTRCA